MSAYSVMAWAIVIGILYMFVRALLNLFGGRRGAARVCTRCGHSGPPKVRTRGSFAIELVLWLLFIVPGLIYSLWRLSSRQQVCESCGAADLVAPDSPVGQRLLNGQRAD